MASPINYIGAQNPFNLAPPPDWWLRKLYERDSELRVFPGLTQACYRVGRRTPRAALLKPVALESETTRMMRNGCIPVVSIRPGVTWNDDFFRGLEQRDTWKYGGSIEDSVEKSCDALDRAEQAVEDRKDREQDDELAARGSSAYLASLIRRRSLAFVRGHQGSST